MVEVSVTASDLALEVQGAHKVWALKKRIEIPLTHVDEVRTEPAAIDKLGRTGVKLTGTRLGGRIVAGTFRQDGRNVFWDVVRQENAIVIETRDESYGRLVVEVEDPAATVARIQQALDGRETVPS
jgi:hypothetical protein